MEISCRRFGQNTLKSRNFGYLWTFKNGWQLLINLKLDPGNRRLHIETLKLCNRSIKVLTFDGNMCLERILHLLIINLIILWFNWAILSLIETILFLIWVKNRLGDFEIISFALFYLLKDISGKKGWIHPICECVWR